MKALRPSHIGIVVALVAGCQATEVGRQGKPPAFKPSAQSTADVGTASNEFEGRRTGYSAAVDAPADSDEPSALEKLSEGTQGFFSRAGQALSPKKDTTSAKSAGWGSSGAKTKAKKPKKPSRPSALYRLFHPEPKRPKTLNEWMAQPRLDP